MPFEVYLYNIPKVSEDGKQVIPVPDNRMEEFAGLEEARKFAAEHKDKFDRVVLMRKDDEGQKMLERYVDGQHEDAEAIVRR
jgi:hypothetical protein